MEGVQSNIAQMERFRENTRQFWYLEKHIMKLPLSRDELQGSKVMKEECTNGNGALEVK